MKEHSRNALSYLKSLENEAFGSYDGFKMYCAIGVSRSSLHRESTDSLIRMVYKGGRQDRQELNIAIVMTSELEQQNTQLLMDRAHQMTHPIEKPTNFVLI